VLVGFVYIVVCQLFALVLLLARSDCSKELEILLLRHELSILRRQARRPQVAPRDRLVLAALSRVLPRPSWHAFLVTPETLLRHPDDLDPRGRRRRACGRPLLHCAHVSAKPSWPGDRPLLEGD
jgi:putative transposase